jgi:inner membrane protein
MKDTATKKVTLIAAIAILLWITSGFVRTVSEERRGRQAEVLRELGESMATNQRLDTPFLKLYFEEDYVDDKKPGRSARETREVRPKILDFVGQVGVESRSRGIFHAQAFDLDWKGSMKFDLPAEVYLSPAPNYPHGHVFLKSAELVVPLGTQRGLKRLPDLKINGWAHPLRAVACGSSLCYDLPGTYEEIAKTIHDVSLALEVTGMDEVAFNANAEQNDVVLRSNWRSPGFHGSLLPTKREVSDQGFTAEWKIVGLPGTSGISDFSVRFMEPVDVYTLTDRATKYAILFILSVFGGFFLVEIAAKLRLHPLQYALVGAALVVFYLLVLSMAEHMRFGLAYGIAAVASVALITYYLIAALRDKTKAWFMGASLSAQYGLLFVIISAEDYALLFGSSLTFATLAAIMIATRKLDWYKLELTGGSEESRA